MDGISLGGIMIMEYYAMYDSSHNIFFEELMIMHLANDLDE